MAESVTLEATLKPWRHLFADVPRTFIPYRDEKGEPSLYKNQDYRDFTVWGDLAQPVRGVVNMAKGLGRIGRGICKLFPPIFIILWYIERYSGKPLLTSTEEGTTYMPYPWWVAFKEVGKELLYDFINGVGIFLRGALQLVTTPLLLIRIPLRWAITKAIKNQDEYGQYNAMDFVQDETENDNSKVKSETTKENKKNEGYNAHSESYRVNTFGKENPHRDEGNALAYVAPGDIANIIIKHGASS